MKNYFDGLQRVSKGLEKGLKNDDMTSNFYDFASRGFTETIRSKQPVFSEKMCIKECLEVEKTHVV